MRKKIEVFSFISLLIWIVILLLIRPFFSGIAGMIVMNLSFTGVLVSTIYYLTEKRKIRLAVLLLAAFAVIFQWMSFFIDSLPLHFLSSIFILAFLGLTITFLLIKIFYALEIKRDLIFGAISAYFLIGIFWAVLYHVIEMIMPNSFKGVAQDSSGFLASFDQFLYFSFVTLSTLGYGDIVAINQGARNIAVIEAVFGQFYIATLVAGLIGMLIREKKV